MPAFAVIASTVIGLLTTALNFFAPSEVFGFLLATSGAIALLVYLVIAVCQLRMRYKLGRSNTQIALKNVEVPVLTWLVIGFIVAALTTMVVLPEHRSEVSATGLLTLLTIALGLISQKRRKAYSSPRARSALSN